ncbi:MAG: SDR family NAD(P)-dependent oxidoreductase [Promethearchaeota archaeon]
MVEKFLEGKGTLITGAASGFGKGIAIEYAKRGADLVLVDINEELLEETCKKIEQDQGQKVIPIVCDVSDSEQVQAMAKQAFKELDNIYILFNNAGIAAAYGRNILRVKEKDWDRVMGVNLKGQWLVAQSMCRKMKAQKFQGVSISGKIICTSSIAGMNVNAKIPAYSISKAGIIALMQLLAKTLAPKILVNSIAPGYHTTGIYLNSIDDMRLTMKDGNVKTPLNRAGTVEDIVNLVLFLASSASDFITGHNFPVDGGIVDVGVPANYLETNI